MKVFETKTRALVESASGLCVIVAPNDSHETDLLVGRAMQRAWLAITAQQMAVQPMMSLCVLDNVLLNGPPALVASLDREKTDALGREFRAITPEIGQGHAGFLLRFGFAPTPSGRTGRLDPKKVTDIACQEIVLGRN
jgi:hypothetical protein